MCVQELVLVTIEKKGVLNRTAASSELDFLERSLERMRGKEGFRGSTHPAHPRPHFPQQQAEEARLAQTQEEKRAAALRVELHNASGQIQSLQAETESLRALVSGPGRALASLAATVILNYRTGVIGVHNVQG